MEAYKKCTDETLTDEMYIRIEMFVKAKRGAVLEKLEEYGELSQGELGKRVNSTPASLANILLRMEQFEYKLLETRSEGRYRYYRLSPLGKAYLARKSLEEKKDDSVIIPQEVLKLLQNAEGCIAEYRQIKGEAWEISMDDDLLLRINGCGKIPDGREQKLIDLFLKYVELIILKEYDQGLNKVINMLDSNILRGRLNAFLDFFEPFRELLKLLADGENDFEVYEMLDAIFRNEDIEKCTLQSDWVDLGKKLADAIENIECRASGKSKQDIYDCFLKYIPENTALCAYMMNGVWCKMRCDNESAVG